jgi:ABC-type sulfate/molybdate transport systems ATPase subunit
MSTPALLELRDVEVHAGDRVILDIDRLAVAAGEVLAVLGLNGAGKSTLLRVAGGLRAPDRGTTRLDGELAVPARLRAASAAVLQRPLLRRASVRANVETGLRFRHVARSERARRAHDWLNRLALGPLADRPAHSLSGGEAQRVSIARALALEPRLLLLDEPFAGLDAPTRAELLADIRDVLAATDTGALFVTHDRHEAAAIGDRIAILHAGALRQIGLTATVLDGPADPVCARLLGYDNVLSAALASRLLDTPSTGPVAVRAADVELRPDGAKGRLARQLGVVRD